MLARKIRTRANKRALSKLSEKKGARRLGGRVQPASGALPDAGLKGDITTKDFVVEDKITRHSSFRVTVDLLKKVRGEAVRAGKRPAMRVTLQEDNLTVYVLLESDFEELTC